MPNSDKFKPIDATKTPRFADIATFMRTVRHEISDEIDIGLCGVPFDLGLNYRSGPRDAPAAVRDASRLIRMGHPVSGLKPYELCNVADAVCWFAIGAKAVTGTHLYIDGGTHLTVGSPL